MIIQEKDLYHGAALTQVVEHRSFKALNRATQAYGHYLINTDRHLYVKHSKKKESPWQFTFEKKHIQLIAQLIQNGRKVFLCIVCGGKTVCVLTEGEISEVLNLDDKHQQWISVSVPRSGSCHVKGGGGKLERTIPHNSFPDKVFVRN